MKGRLPDRTIAEVDGDYIEAWEKFARPTCEALGIELHGFDPGVSFECRIDGHFQTVGLPMWFAQRLNETCTAYQRAIKERDEAWEELQGAIEALRGLLTAREYDMLKDSETNMWEVASELVERYDGRKVAE